MTVDGLVNVQCGETFQKYEIDPFQIYVWKKKEYFGQVAMSCQIDAGRMKNGN